jgi:hypothetical protein
VDVVADQVSEHLGISHPRRFHDGDPLHQFMRAGV